MNWLDILLLLIIAWSVAASFRKGFTREVVGLASVALALILGVWLYGTAGTFFTPYVSSRQVANLAGFFVVFLGVLLLGAIVSYALGKFLKVTGLSIVDHALGAAFGALRGILIGIALITGIMAFSQGDRPPESIVKSRMAPYVASAARVVASIAPNELKQGFRKTYAEAKRLWGKATEDGSRSKPNQKENNERKL